MSRDWMLKDYIPHNAVGIEVGVWIGTFSKKILKLTNPKKLYLVDPWEYDPNHASPLFGKDRGQSEMDRLYRKVCTTFKNNKRVEVKRNSNLDDFKDESVDWVYCDGDHSFGGTLTALEDAFRVVKNKGIIAGDDYNTNGWWQEDVINAVNVFIKKYPVEVIRIHQNQFILQKRTDKKDVLFSFKKV